MNALHGWVASRARNSRPDSPGNSLRASRGNSLRASRLARAVSVPTLAALTLAACTSNATEGGTKIAVTVNDDACALSATAAPAGHAVFTVTNSGSRVAEFYVYAADGTKIVAEVENVGPGLSRDLVVTLEAGTYVTSCDPGMDGDDIRADFTVTGDGQAATVSGERADALAAASAGYLAYVQTEVDQLTTKTQAFADAFAAGDDDAARSIYADARVHWERIEPIAEAFGDLDPSLDLREADLGPQELWTGWHRAEKTLWPPVEGYEMTDEDRTMVAGQLVSDTEELQRRVSAADFTIAPFAIGNGAKELLDELATSKITGEEEIWSGTDLWDMQANVDGAYAAYEVLRPIVAATDPSLVAELDARFAEVEAVLATHGSIEEGFVVYSALGQDQVIELSRAVESLSEPLSRLTAAAVL